MAEKKRPLIENIQLKMGSSSVYKILKGNSSTYSADDLKKDLNKLRGQYKRRISEYEKFNTELTQALGLVDAENEKFVQQSQIETTLSMNELLQAKKKDIKAMGETQYYQMLWNRLSHVMNKQKNNKSVLAGQGGIYEQQAKFLNYFLDDKQKIDISEDRLTKDTNKGIRQDIIDKYKYIQNQLGEDKKMDIRFIKEFWNAFDVFKSHLSSKIQVKASDEDPEQGRKLLKYFAQGYLSSGFNRDALISKLNEGFSDGTINNFDNLSKLKDMFDKVIETANDIQKEDDTTQQTIEQRIEKDKSSDLTLEPLESIVDEVNADFNETTSKRKRKSKEQKAIDQAEKQEIRRLKKELDKEKRASEEKDKKINELESRLSRLEQLFMQQLSNIDTSSNTTIQTIKSSTSTNRTVKANTTKGTKKKQQKETKGLK